MSLVMWVALLGFVALLAFLKVGGYRLDRVNGIILGVGVVLIVLVVLWFR